MGPPPAHCCCCFYLFFIRPGKLLSSSGQDPCFRGLTSCPCWSFTLWLWRLTKANMAAIRFLLICLLPAVIVAKPQYSSSGIPANVLEGLPSQTFYQPEKSPNIPILPGERRCDNYYNGEVMPCLMRPWLPPFSYSTTEGNNGEYKRRRRAARTWRAL